MEPDTTPASVSISESVKKRGALLTIWLVLIIIFNLVGAINYFTSPVLATAFPDTPALMFTILGIVELIVVVCAAALLAWKKWGFLGICTMAAVSFIINVVMGMNIGSALLYLVVGVGILYLILRPKWKQLA